MVASAGPSRNWTPTAAQVERYEWAVFGTNQSEEIITHKSLPPLPRSKVVCMREREWLNDEIINMYMALAQASVAGGEDPGQSAVSDCGWSARLWIWGLVL